MYLFITWENIQHLHGHDAPITHVEFSPDDTRLLTFSYDEEKDKATLSLWDTSNLNKIVMVHRLKFAMYKAFFICNGEKILIMQKNGDFGLLNGLTGESIKKDNKPICKDHPFSEITHPKYAPLIIWSN
jgi:WD40 repeat protein